MTLRPVRVDRVSLDTLPLIGDAPWREGYSDLTYRTTGQRAAAHGLGPGDRLPGVLGVSWAGG
jgi:hypothetical protein